MNMLSISRAKAHFSRILSVAVLASGFLTSVPDVFGQAGRGTADDWFVKAEKGLLQMSVKGGERRDIIPSHPGDPLPLVDRKKPPLPDYLMGKIKWGATQGTADDTIQDGRPCSSWSRHSWAWES